MIRLLSCPQEKADGASPALRAVKVVFSRSLVQRRRGLLASALGGKISTVDGGLAAIATGTLGFARRLAGKSRLSITEAATHRAT